MGSHQTTETTAEIARSLLPDRPEAGHKGTFGHVFILAGSRGFTGAAKLASWAAGRSGVGLVTVGIPEPLADPVAASLLEAMSLSLPATKAGSFGFRGVELAIEFASTKQAVVLGPGISQEPGTQRFVQTFVPQCATPLLIDADGLNCLSRRPTVIDQASAPLVLTPHPGEMARLCSRTTGDIQADRTGAALEFASRYGCVVILKGKNTVIASGDGRCYINPTGNPGLATGGTGDVLAGLAGGLMAQGLAGFDAAALAAYVHGRAADLVAEKRTSRGMLARDVVEAIPLVWRELEGLEA